MDKCSIGDGLYIRIKNNFDLLIYMIEREKIKICRKIPDDNEIPDDFHKKIVWTD
jgi:hypothetical protein